MRDLEVSLIWAPEGMKWLVENFVVDIKSSMLVVTSPELLRPESSCVIISAYSLVICFMCCGDKNLAYQNVKSPPFHHHGNWIRWSCQQPQESFKELVVGWGEVTTQMKVSQFPFTCSEIWLIKKKLLSSCDSLYCRVVLLAFTFGLNAFCQKTLSTQLNSTGGWTTCCVYTHLNRCSRWNSTN